jgi:hypothetical protein
MHVLVSRVMLVVGLSLFVGLAWAGVGHPHLHAFAFFGAAVVAAVAVNVLGWLWLLQDERAMGDALMSALTPCAVSTPNRGRRALAKLSAFGGIAVAIFGVMLMLAFWVDDWQTPVILFGTECAGMSLHALGSGYLADTQLVAEFQALGRLMRDGMPASTRDQ